MAEWLETVPDGQLYLSALVLGELQQGVARLRKKDPRQAAAYDAWLNRLRHEFGDRILPVTTEVAREWGLLGAGGPLPVLDGLLAATARAHGLTLATRNVRGLAQTGVALLDPFGPS